MANGEKRRYIEYLEGIIEAINPALLKAAQDKEIIVCRRWVDGKKVVDAEISRYIVNSIFTEHKEYEAKIAELESKIISYKSQLTRVKNENTVLKYKAGTLFTNTEVDTLYKMSEKIMEVYEFAAGIDPDIEDCEGEDE